MENINKPTISDVKIEIFYWPGVVEEILKEDFHCYRIGDVLDLTAETIELQNAFLKKDIIGMCNTLINLDSELFYKSKLYNSLKNNKKYAEIIEKPTKSNDGCVNL